MDYLPSMHHSMVATHSQTRTAWTAQEDAILRARVAAIGAGAGLWPEVAKGLPGRTSKSCAERWQTHLNPAYVRSSEQEFSDWEIAVMILAYARHGSNWLKVSEYLPMRSPQNIKNQVNYFNSKPEHVRDNRFLAARSTLEDLLAAEPDTVKHRRETLQDVLLKGQSALPAGALQAAYAAAKLSAPNANSSSRLHPYARPTSLHTSYGIQHPTLQSQGSGGQVLAAMVDPAAAAAAAAASAAAAAAAQPGMNAMMLLAQAACGDDEQQDDSAAAAAALSLAGAVGEMMAAGQMMADMVMDQDVIQKQMSGQHGVSGLSLPMIQTRPQQGLLQHKGSGGSSSSSKQAATGQMCYYNPAGLPASHMSMMMPGLHMLMPGMAINMHGSPMASSDRMMPGSATATTAANMAAAAANTASPASLAAEAAAAAAVLGGRPSHAGSSQGGGIKVQRGATKVVSRYEDLLADDMSTSVDDDENTGDMTPLSQRVAAAAAAAVSAATQQAVNATQQACHVLTMATMLAQQHHTQLQQHDAKPAASDRSSQPNGLGAAGSGEQQQLAALAAAAEQAEAPGMQQLNNQLSDNAKAVAAGAATMQGLSLEESVRSLLVEHFDRMQKLQAQLQQDLHQQLAADGRLH